MPLLESALALLAIAVLLLLAARRFSIPYPSMLAMAGGCVAALPWAPNVAIEPRLALALFVAPAVMDSAFEMPPRVLLRHWLPLTSLAVLLILATTAAVAWAAHAFAALPWAAAIALGAVVAPPDAAAASAVLRQFSLPRRTMAVLQGESLLNDAVALLIFGVALSAGTMSDVAWTRAVPMLLIAIPGGALLGVLLALVHLFVLGKVAGTLSSIIVQFVAVYGAWILAERLHVSSIASVASLAMVVAHFSPSRTSARDRVSANAVWAASVFVLNVLAFLLVGLEARTILAGLDAHAFWHALRVAVATLGIVTVVRVVWVMTYGSSLRQLRSQIGEELITTQPPTTRVGLLVSWCGMRGLVTLATALALPSGFPDRDLIVLSAFVVVVGTLVVQGLTIRPLIRLLGIEADCSLYLEVSRGRVAMLNAALLSLKDVRGQVPAAVRAEYLAAMVVASDPLHPQARTLYDELRLEAIASQRVVLNRWRRFECIDDDAFHRLEEELDRAELNATPREGMGLLNA